MNWPVAFCCNPLRSSGSLFSLYLNGAYIPVRIHSKVSMFIYPMRLVSRGKYQINYLNVAADRAKSIKTEARVNQEATNKIIKELIAEKERLLKELEGAKHGGTSGISKEGMWYM